MAGKFIVFEGIDGSGKETQIAMLARKLVDLDIKFSLFKYPTEKAVKVKEYLAGERKPKGENDVFHWYMDDLKEGQEDLLDAVSSGWVICDRYVLSTAAYQGVGGKLEARMKQLGKTPWLEPDVIVWLDIQVDEGMKRKGKQKTPDVHEKNKRFLEEVGRNYGKLCRSEWLCGNWARIDAGKKKDEVFASVCRALGL